MKKILIYLAFLLPLTAFAQEPQAFVVNGKFGNLNTPAKAYLAYQVGANKVVDSAVITNGTFQFKGDVLNPTSASLLLDHKGKGLNKVDSTADVLNFYVEKGDINLTSPDSAYKAQITGSKMNDDSKVLMAKLKPIMQRAKTLNVIKNSASEAQLNSAEFQNSIQ